MIYSSLSVSNKYIILHPRVVNLLICQIIHVIRALGQKAGQLIDLGAYKLQISSCSVSARSIYILSTTLSPAANCCLPGILIGFGR